MATHFAKLLGADSSEPGAEVGQRTVQSWEGEILESVDKRLGEKITRQELQKVIRPFKNKKAPGEDGLTVEFINAISNERIDDRTEIVNRIWERGELIKGWEIARIYPIYKVGDEEKASNYRGISLLDIGYKILTSIIVGRINKWGKINKVIKESQAGFRMQRGTRDHIFVLNSLINKILKKSGKKICVQFVDVKAAFDEVNIKVMLNKLWEQGIRGKMHKMLKRIYSKTINEVITGDGITKSFQTGNEVKQGCPISPILFNI